jgi:hypothetical protein
MLRYDCQLRRFSRVQSSLGGTTETQKQIIARGPVDGNPDNDGKPSVGAPPKAA